MSKPIIFEDGRLNYFKLLILIVFMTLFIASFIMVIELVETLFSHFIHGLSMVAFTLFTVHLALVVYSELQLLMRIIKAFFLLILITKPKFKQVKLMFIEYVRTLYLVRKSLQNELCVFRC